MKYDFSVLKTKYGNFLEMNFLREGNSNILSGLFNSSNINIELKNEWINKVDAILNGNSNHEELGVEAYDIDIEKEKTYIFFYYPENGQNEVEISTKEFRNLSQAWFDKLEEFQNNSENID